ncbi:MAG: helix-turn-helix domain-containing protein [Oscillospiraceae bacterium]|nr:helix-turn-helix domain-containing protein [Oscillospiraceae bacterium]
MIIPVRTAFPALLVLLINLALLGAFVCVVVLLIRALLKYLRSGNDRRSPPEQVKSLGEALKVRRTAAGFTQEYVAEALGVSRQAVSKWENGASEPSTANLIALSKLYGLPVDELLRPAETDE